MYAAVGSLYRVGHGSDNLGSFPSGAIGFNCVITLCIQTTLANQAIHPVGVSKLALAISRGNNAQTVREGVVGSSLYMQM